jgi:hypothetical protein
MKEREIKPNEKENLLSLQQTNDCVTALFLARETAQSYDPCMNYLQMFCLS